MLSASGRAAGNGATRGPAACCCTPTAWSATWQSPTCALPLPMPPRPTGGPSRCRPRQTPAQGLADTLSCLARPMPPHKKLSRECHQTTVLPPRSAQGPLLCAAPAAAKGTINNPGRLPILPGALSQANTSCQADMPPDNHAASHTCTGLSFTNLRAARAQMPRPPILPICVYSHLPSGSATSPTMTVMASCARKASLTCCMYSACVGAQSLSAAMGIVRKVTTFTAGREGACMSAPAGCLCGRHVQQRCLPQRAWSAGFTSFTAGHRGCAHQQL